jgi:hypothetical protein
MKVSLQLNSGHVVESDIPPNPLLFRLDLLLARFCDFDQRLGFPGQKGKLHIVLGIESYNFRHPRRGTQFSTGITQENAGSDCKKNDDRVSRLHC